MRYVPWLPTPLLGVAELEPPSGTALCVGESVFENINHVNAGEDLTHASAAVLDCGANGGVIESITFASFGDVSGTCGQYTYTSLGSHPPPPTTTTHPLPSSIPPAQVSVRKAVEAQCLGRSSCNIEASAEALGLDASRLNESVQGGALPARRLAVQAQCSNHDKQHTYWNFTLLDDMMLDYWNAVGGNTTPQIPNFSTPPTWLYDNTSWSVRQCLCVYLCGVMCVV